MKTDARYHLTFSTRLRLFTRLLGITGLLAAGVGAVLLFEVLSDLSISGFLEALRGEHGQTGKTGAYLLAGGAAAIALMLLVELLAGFTAVTGRRSAVGVSSLVQVGLAIAIVVALNVYSFQHYRRWDFTQNGQFTLDETIVRELQKLRTPTTIVVLQQHKTFGRLSEKPDAYDYAAERKVVEKVKDLVSEFQELGRQFRVITLDVEEEGFDRRLQDETKDKPDLADAIRAAPENSIFFYSNGRVQRMSFNEFYQLDKSASKAANGGRGNLVLQPQGAESFARRILAIQEKKPKVALAVVHEVLTSSGSQDAPDQYIHTGLRKALEAHGFEVVDLILKRWKEDGPPEPAAYNTVENRVDDLAEELEGIDANLRELRDERKQAQETQKLMRDPASAIRQALREQTGKDPTEEEVGRQVEAFRRQFRAQLRRDLDDMERQRQVQGLDDMIRRIDEEIPKLEAERSKREEELQKSYQNERALADRRVSDVKAKMNRILDDCDLLIVPRQTLINIHANFMIGPRAHALTDSPDTGMPFAERAARSRQVEVIREFMRRGKPVLACLGPINDRRSGAPTEPLDDFERLLADRGIELGRQTILFTAEERDFAAAAGEDSFGTGGRAEIPQVEFNDKAGPGGRKNPIAAAMLITGRNVEQHLEIRLRHPRPIYLAPGYAEKMAFPPAFMFTSADSWNEERPFPSFRPAGQGRAVLAYVPRFQAASRTDPKKGTHDEERRGPFPIGVAVELPPPAEWSDESVTGFKALAGMLGPYDGVLAAALTAKSAQIPSTERKPSRLVVIGHGGVFTGKELSPATENLLLNTTNWLLAREERLPHETPPWSYPRVQLDEQQKSLWHWGALLGLPVLFAYVGLVVLMLRRVR